MKYRLHTFSYSPSLFVYHVRSTIHELINPPRLPKRAHVPKLLIMPFSPVFSCPHRSVTAICLFGSKCVIFMTYCECDLHETRDERPAQSATKRHRAKRAVPACKQMTSESSRGVRGGTVSGSALHYIETFLDGEYYIRSPMLLTGSVLTDAILCLRQKRSH